jgi:hypothetical protein
MVTRTLSAIVVASLAVAAFAALGCARSAKPTTAPTRSKVFDTDVAKRWASTPFAFERSIDPRKPGDFAVFRVSGLLVDEPRTIAERVVAREGAILVVDYDVTSSSGTHETLRVSFDAVGAEDEAVFAVSRVALGEETPVEVAAFASLLDATNLGDTIVDHGEVFRTPPFVREIDGRSFDCEESSNHVTIGGLGAIKTSTVCPALRWGAVESEIVTDEGEVLQRSELVELGESDPSKPIYVAKFAPRWMY